VIGRHAGHRGEGGLAAVRSLVRWRGWRPPVLDFEDDERGGQVWLVLDREGDTALLPCAQVGYLFYEPEDGDGPDWDMVQMACGEAAYRDEIEASVQSLRADGWRVLGRLEATFVGCWTEDDFWARTEAVLRQRDAAK
jgi:hypothetical protein